MGVEFVETKWNLSVLAHTRRFHRARQRCRHRSSLSKLRGLQRQRAGYSVIRAEYRGR